MGDSVLGRTSGLGRRDGFRVGEELCDGVDGAVGWAVGNELGGEVDTFFSTTNTPSSGTSLV